MIRIGGPERCIQRILALERFHNWCNPVEIYLARLFRQEKPLFTFARSDTVFVKTV